MKKIKFFRGGSYDDLEAKINKWIEDESPNIIQINPLHVTELGSYMIQILYIDQSSIEFLGGE